MRPCDRRDVRVGHQVVRDEADGTHAGFGDQTRERLGGVQVVAVDDDEPVVAREILGGRDRVRGSEWLRLNGVLDGHPLEIQPVVVLADRGVLGSDHQTHPGEAGVGEPGEHVVQERTLTQRHHGLGAGGGCGGLFLREGGIARGGFHPGAQAPGHHDSFGYAHQSSNPRWEATRAAILSASSAVDISLNTLSTGSVPENLIVTQPPSAK